MKVSSMLIKEGIIHDPVTKKKYQADILIEDGQIQEVVSYIDRKGHEVVEAKGLWVLPGLMDMHVHLREPGREDEETILSGVKAAINGGFVSLVCMANTDPPVDDPSVVDYILAEARRIPGFRLYPVGTITKDRKGSQLSEMYLLRERGVVAFSDDGSPIMDALTMRRAMEYCKPLGIPLILHEEDLNLSEGGQMHEGFYSTLLGLHGIPSLSEEVMVFRDIALAEAIGVPVHIAHLSSAGSVEIVRQAKRRGARVSCEVTVNHLIFCDADLAEYDTNLKVNPPIRSEADRKALIEGLLDGTIDAIVTDHAPHAVQEKELDFDLAPFGAVGLETALPALITYLVEGKGIEFLDLLPALTVNPARVLGLEEPGIESGRRADLTLVDPDRGFRVGEESSLSRSKNSPFLGKELKGTVVETIVAGKRLKMGGVIVL